MGPNCNVMLTLRPQAIYDECKQEHQEGGFEKKKHASIIRNDNYAKDSSNNEGIVFHFKSEWSKSG